MISPLEDGDLPPFRTLVESEDPRVRAAAARAVIYSALSLLTASPATSEVAPRSLATVVDRASLAAGSLPCDFDFASLLAAASALHEEGAGEALAAVYATLFEVGDHGPPLPIREEIAPGVGTSAKEEVVRFYELFGYDLGSAMSWQPDHVSVLLEFLHYLAIREGAARTAEEQETLARAQRDFLARHLLDWLPPLAQALARRKDVPLEGVPEYLHRVFESVAGFAAADHAWLAARLRTQE